MISVLIVEDEIFIAMEIERILEDAGYNVVAIATDQSEALSSAQNAQLAFVDVNLRDGPIGPRIAHELASQHGTRVVYVTANPSQIGELAPDAIGCIQKPFTADAILAAAARDRTYDRV
ncbi:response regulator [Sphingobium phenoxybenzoativorans]|uniref:response regulator n=1 Tax=Sphingobium phenoxybenzoativorans TaxID=1592790 RepID=UPI0009F2C4DE|nr:response regulator [Sphingobium phenoxybenzoativorans]